MAQRVPGGGLISWGSFTFVAGRSKLLTNSGFAAPTQRTIVPGGARKVDRSGQTRVPQDYTIMFEYNMAPTTSIHGVQTQMDALQAVWESNQTQTLTAFGSGDITDTISGSARLESCIKTNDDVNFHILTLTFFCENGMT